LEKKGEGLGPLLRRALRPEEAFTPWGGEGTAPPKEGEEKKKFIALKTQGVTGSFQEPGRGRRGLLKVKKGRGLRKEGVLGGGQNGEKGGSVNGELYS